MELLRCRRFYQFAFLFCFTTQLWSPTDAHPAAKKVGPGSSPLDPNNELDGTEAELGELLSSVGGASHSLVMKLTGIAVSDCAGNFKGKDTDSMTCDEFLETLSGCDSMQNVKDMILKAKEKYKKSGKSGPCFKDRKSKSKKKMKH